MQMLSFLLDSSKWFGFKTSVLAGIESSRNVCLLNPDQKKKKSCEIKKLKMLGILFCWRIIFKAKSCTLIYTEDLLGVFCLN